MKLSRFISFKEETASAISEYDMDEILSIHSLPVSIESEHLSFDRALVKQFTLTLPKDEQARALALLLDYSTVIDTDPALCEFSVCLRQLVAIGYFMPQLLRRNQLKFLESVKIILGRIFVEFQSKKHFAHQCSMALSYAISPLAKRMNDVDIINPRYKIYQDILELLLELYKNEEFFTVKEMPRFLPFFFNSIGAFKSDSGDTYSPTQIHIFNDLLDLLYKYVDKSVEMDIQVFDVIRSIVQIVATKSLPLDPSIRLIVFINSLGRLNDEISNFIFGPERCASISKFLVKTIKVIEFPVNEEQSNQNSFEKTAILNGSKNYFSSINHMIDRTFSEDIKAIPLSERTTNQKVTNIPTKIPQIIANNVNLIQIIMGALALFNPGVKSFRSDFHRAFIESLLNDEELKNMPIFSYFISAWLYQFIGSDISPVLECLHDTNFYYTVYFFIFIKKPNNVLKDFVLKILSHLVDKYHINFPYFLSDFLIFLGDYSRYLQIDQAIFDFLKKTSIVSTLTFIRGCKLSDLPTKLANILSELIYIHENLISKEKESSEFSEDDKSLLQKVETTRKQYLTFIDFIDTFPTIFQCFFDNVEFMKIILCHFYDDSTINFASIQLILLFEQFVAKSDTFLSVVKFFSSFEITKPILLILLQCCSQGFDVNPYEIADIFNNTILLDYLIESSVRLNCDVALEIFLNIFSKMTAKQSYFSFKFDIFLKVENLIHEDFDSSSLWKIVFGDDKGNSEPREIVNTSPISLLFAISIKTNKVIEFIEFIKKCFNLDEYIIYDLCQSELPARIIKFLAEYRTKEEKDERFDVVFNFFVYISVFSMKSSDLCSLIRLCTSLPGHQRPFFTVNIIKAIEKLLKETENLPPAFFDLCGEKTYLQLQNVPIEIINKEFALYFNLRFLKDRFLGTIFEFANQKSKISLKYSYDKLEITIKNKKNEYKNSEKVQLDVSKFCYLIIEYKSNNILILYNNSHFVFQHEPIIFETDFSYFKALDNVPCQLSHVFLSKRIFNPNERKLLTLLPYCPVSSFHSSEYVRFPPVFMSFFQPSIASDFLFIFNAQISLKRFAINVIDSTTMRVTGRIIQTEPQLLSLLESIGGFLVLMPFFGQIEQPLVGGKESNDNLLSTLIMFFASVLGMYVQNQRMFRKVGGVKILAFLLSLVSLEKLQDDKTIDAICELFSRTTFIPLTLQYIDSILLNFKLWIYLPVEKQKYIYKRFIELIMKRLTRKIYKSFLSRFNISKILTLIRVYLWTNRTNKKICLEDDVKMDINGEKVQGKRPADCAPIRACFWDLIKRISDDFLREDDFDLLVSFCSDTLDLDITKESIDLFSYLITRKNPIAVQYMKKNYRFSTFFDLFKVPDPQLLRKLFKLYLNIDSSFLAPFKKDEWDKGIVRDIDSKSIDIDFLKVIERNMIQPREAHLSAHDTANLTISNPRFIPLYLLAVQSQDEENMMKYFDLIDDLMKMDADLLVGDWDHPFLLLLMAQMPTENSQMNQISKNTVELLAFLYNKSCRSKPKKSNSSNSTMNQTNSALNSSSSQIPSQQTSILSSQFFSMPHFVEIVSYQAKKDYSYIIRLIYIEFLKKENIVDRPYSLIETATFSKIYIQMAKYIMIVPNFDISMNDVNYSFQDLLKLSQKSLISTNNSSATTSSLYLSSAGTSLSSENFKSMNHSNETSLSYDDGVLNSSDFVSTMSNNSLSSLNVDSIQPPSMFESSNPSVALNNNNQLSSSLNSIPAQLNSALGFTNNSGLSPLVSSNINNFQSLKPPGLSKQEHARNLQIHKLFNFAYALRESAVDNNSCEWRDSLLASLLIDALISRALPILSVKEKPTVNRKNPLHPLEVLGFLIMTGLSFQNSRAEFAKLADSALSMFSAMEHMKSHIKRSIQYIFYGLVKVVLDCSKNNNLLNNKANRKIAEILIKCAKIYSEYLQKEYKVTLPSPLPKMEEFNFEQVFSPICEDDSHFQSKISKLIKNEIDKIEGQIDILSKKLYFSLQLIPKLKQNEVPKDVFLRNNLEQFALLRLNENANSMKTYKKLFRNLSAQNGPWQTPEVEIVNHRRLCNNIFGWRRFFLKPNYEFTDHKDASLLRDMGSEQDAKEVYLQKYAKERMLEFKGDLAFVAADNKLNSNANNSNANNDIVLFKLECCNITMKSINSGKLLVTQTSLIFDSPSRFIQIQNESIRKVLLRRYLQINSAIEIFTANKKSYFFDFTSSEQRTVLLEFIKGKNLENLKFIQMTDNDIIPLLKKVANNWQQGKITNFDYLLKLNKYSGRTYHDLSQYPVFPWIISDYKSEVLDLTKPETFRDLSKPMGAINEDRLNNLKSRISDLDKNDETMNFLYGAFYSSSATVIGYLIRMEPFTSLHIELQNGRFDVADRLFVSIPDAWESATTGQMDFRELTPEFFYLPDFLINENKLDLGTLSRNKVKVDDVILPKWASNHIDFISKNRQALEDPFVSLYLPQWINLIFGPNSRLPNSEKVNNVFHPYYYESSIVDKTESEIDIIREYAACFGCAPRQIFMEDPPQRDFSPILFRNAFFGEEKFIQLCENSAIIALSPDCGSIMNVALNSDLDFFIGGQAKAHLQLKMPTELEDICKLEQKAVVSTHSAVVSLPWDCAIFIFKIDSNSPNVVAPEMISRAHNKRITAIATCDEYIATGSEDCTVRIWDNIKLKHSHCISKHRYPITALEINQKLRICVAASSDGHITVNSLVNWDLSFDCFTELKDPGNISVSDFGAIVIAQNGPTNGSSCVVYDQNLKFICSKNFEPSWITSSAIAWNDGMDYLAVAMSDNLIHFYVLPFLEPINCTINTTGYTVTSMAFHKDQMRMLIGDSVGKIHVHRFIH